MSNITIKELGITLNEDDILDRVEERIYREVMRGEDLTDEHGNDVDSGPSRFAEMVQARVVKRLDEAIDNIAAKHVIPNMEKFVEDFCLQETNKWGDKTGQKLTFTEYLVSRAFSYMEEPVNHNGETEKEGGYGWRKHTTRITHMIDDHLKYHIKTAVEKILETGNKALGTSIEKAIRIQLNEINKKLKVKVEV